MKTAAIHRQRGVGTLAVVLVLFFIVSLVAAYTSRNLIFELRTATNQYRSTAALEAAEAGVGWALAQLNDGRITANCLASTQASDSTFRNLYLSFNSGPATPGLITANYASTAPTYQYLYPTCVLDGNAWTCSCPSNNTPTLNAPSTPGLHPAFRLYFKTVTAQSGQGQPPGLVKLYSNGCTKLDTNFATTSNTCLLFNPSSSLGPSVAAGSTNEGTAGISVLLGLTGGLASPPVNALTAVGNINITGATGLTVNVAPGVTGPLFPNNLLPPSPYAVHTGGGTVTGVTATWLPGTPSGASILSGDSALAALSANPTPSANPNANLLFETTFNMGSSTFQNQPALVVLNCGTSACTASQVRNAITLNPNRPIWVQGDLTVDSAGDIGSLTAPVLLVVSGNSLTFGSNPINIYGLVFATTTTQLNLSGAALLRGALMAEGDISGSSTATVSYDPDLLRLLRATTGSFVRVPGGWQDFQ